MKIETRVTRVSARPGQTAAVLCAVISRGGMTGRDQGDQTVSRRDDKAVVTRGDALGIAEERQYAQRQHGQRPCKQRAAKQPAKQSSYTGNCAELAAFLGGWQAR